MHWSVISYLTLSLLNSLSFSSSNSELLNDNEYLSNYDEVSFFKSNLPDQVIDLENIDEDLLNATLIFYINKKRARGKRTAFHFNEELFSTCNNIVLKYSGSTLKRFSKKKIRFKKILKKRLKESNFNGTYVEGFSDYLPLMKMSNKTKYIHNEEIDDGEHLFFYKKKKRKKAYQPIDAHTYHSLAESIFKRCNFFERNRAINGKQYSEIGCKLSVIKKNKNKIPFVEVVWILGGYRLGLIEKNN